MKTTLITILLAITASAASAAVAPELDYWWDIETTIDGTTPIPPMRHGESLLLRPRMLVRRQAMDLTNVTQVTMRYWTDDMIADEVYYTITGSVYSATAGRIEIPWTPLADTGADAYYYQIRVGNSEGQLYRGHGTMSMRGVYGAMPTNYVRSVQTWDWQDWEHINTAFAPFLDEDDLIAINQRFAAHDQDIEDLTDLVGDGVAGVSSSLVAHVEAQGIVDAGQDEQIAAASAWAETNLQTFAAGQVIRDSGQDEQIQMALESANMGGDVSGVSTQATVVATRGRPFPTAADVPADMEAIVWDSSLNGGSGGYKHGSVDLSGIEDNISNLQASAVSQSYVDTEISEVRGLVDGNDHTHQLTESFDGVDWLEIADGVWQHASGWMAYNANIIGGSLVLDADEGYMVMDTTQCISRIVMQPSNTIWAAQYATNALSTTWWGYDATRDNIVATNMFAVKLINGGASSVSIAQIDLYTWTFPERVAFTRDFAGLHLLVDTPPGDQLREAANVQYVNSTAVTGDVSGTLSSAITVNKIKGGLVNSSSRANGYGLIWYSSISEHRYVDMATQYELDAAIAPLCTIASYNALAARVTAAEAGGIAISGDVTGGHLQTTTVARIQGTAIDPPTVNQTTPVYDLSQGKIVWLSVLNSNLVYSTGSNSIESVPAQSAAFYRGIYGTNAIMPLVLDQQILGWLGQDGLTIPYGTINILQSNLTSNVRLYDGDAAAPSLSTVSDPTTGWYRPAENTWRYVAGGNIIFDIGVDGIALGTGKTITGLTGYAGTADVAQVSANVLSVSGRVDTVEGWGDHASAGYASTADVAEVTADVLSVSGRVDTVEGWGDHASAGYAGTADVVKVAADVLSVSGRVDTVEGWGDHASAGYVTGTPWTLLGYIGAPAATSAAEAVVGVYTGKIAAAWQNPYSTTNWTWTSDGHAITLTGYTGPDDVVIPDMIDGLPVTTIGYLCFSPGGAGSDIVSISGGANLTDIGESVCYGCTNLVSVSLDVVRNLGTSAFNGISSLTSVILPSVTNIGDSAFSGGLTISTFDAENVISIGSASFESCEALESLRFPHIENIGNYAFQGAMSLSSMTFSGNAPVIGTDIYAYIPSGQLTNYLTNPIASGWGDTFGGQPIVRLPITADSATVGGATITTSGTNILIVIGGVTNRVMLETYP